MQQIVIAGVWAAVLASCADAQQVIARAKPGQSPSLESVPALAALGIQSMRRTVDFPLADPALASSLGLDRYYTLALRPGRDAVIAAAAVSRLTACFDSVETEHVGVIAHVQPNDPHFHRQWALHNIGQGDGCSIEPTLIPLQRRTDANGFDINAPQAWTIAASAAGLKVAVVDSGISPHPDLPPLGPGWSFDGGPTTDGCDHGTHVAGIIGASANNGVGIAGVAWGVTLMPVRVLNGCSGTDTNYGRGIIWAADHADIANSSLQYYNVNSFMCAAVQYAAGRGLLMVAASGNLNQVVAFPARWPEVIAVGATDQMDRCSYFSNPGPEVAISAPGENVYSVTMGYSGTAPGYTCMSGTSMASPHVAATAALLAGVRGGVDEAITRRILSLAVRDLGPPGHDVQHGWGRLNLEFALRLGTCYADADGSGVLTAADVNRFQTLHAMHHPYADLNGDLSWDVVDASQWTELFHHGCPAVTSP